MVQAKHSRIAIDPEVMAGKPCIQATRIPVEHILEKLAAGLSYKDILREHPRLAREDTLAALAFAHDYLTRQDIILTDGEDL